MAAKKKALVKKVVAKVAAKRSTNTAVTAAKKKLIQKAQSTVKKTSRTGAPSGELPLFRTLSSRLQKIRDRLVQIGERKTRYSSQKQNEYRLTYERYERLNQLLAKSKSNPTELTGLTSSFRELGRWTSILRRAYNAAGSANKNTTTKKTLASKVAKKPAPKKAVTQNTIGKKVTTKKATATKAPIKKAATKKAPIKKAATTKSPQ